MENISRVKCLEILSAKSTNCALLFQSSRIWGHETWIYGCKVSGLKRAKEDLKSKDQNLKHVEFMKNGQTINQHICHQILKRLRELIYKKRQEK